jgi:biopolymer transport protein ExbD
MRFARASRRSHELFVEITPMIDVVFLLVIFFMTAAQFASDSRAELNLPRERGEQEEVSEEAGLVINITEEGTIIVSMIEVGLEELRQIVREEIARLPGRNPQRLKLMIRADRNGDTRRLNQVFTMLRDMGVGTARVATEVPR